MTAPYLLHHLLDRSAGAAPRKEAVVDRDRRFTYAELDAAADACAAALLAGGLERRDRVGIYLPKSFEEAAAIFGISRAGGVFVPINPLLRPPQVKHIVADCGVRFLITDDGRREGLGDAVGAAEIVSPAALASGARPERKSPCVGEDLAAILYTSGSTGRPKGVMLSHRNLVAGSRIVSRYLGLGPGERILSVLPFSFDYGLNQLITAVDNGAATVLLTFTFGNQIVKALESERITGLAGVPTIWAVLTQGTPSFAKTPLPHLRYLTNSGGAVPTETVRKLREVLPETELFLMYGLTEAFRSTYLPPAEVDARPTSMGKAIPETEVFVVDDRGRPCAPGQTGILVHHGPTVSLGYWGRPEDTAAVLRPDPRVPPDQGAETVCYSGDLVRMDEEGYLYFVGRGDAMIKSSGYRVSPTEVEEVLMASGALSQAAVIGLPDPVAGQRVHAVVVGADGAALDPEALLAHCAAELPPHMVPRAVEAVAELPRSPNGKVDYKRLRAERTEAP